MTQPGQWPIPPGGEPQQHADHTADPAGSSAPYGSYGPPGSSGSYGQPPNPGPHQASTQPYPQQPYQGPGYQQFGPQSFPPGTDPGRRPDQPFAPSIPTYAMSSDQFRPPRNVKPAWITAIVVAVVVLVVATASFVAWRSDTQPTPPPASPSIGTPAATPTGQGIDFDSDEGKGRLEIADSRWTASGLQVKLRVIVTDGEIQYGVGNFAAFDEQGVTYESSTSDVPVPALGDGYLEAGQTTEGWVSFQVSRQDITVLLIGEYGKAITAYKIDG